MEDIRITIKLKEIESQLNHLARLVNELKVLNNALEIVPKNKSRSEDRKDQVRALVAFFKANDLRRQEKRVEQMRNGQIKVSATPYTPSPKKVEKPKKK